MVNLAQHTTKRGRILNFDDTIHFGKAQGIERSFLIDGCTDSALGLLNLYRCHIVFIL